MASSESAPATVTRRGSAPDDCDADCTIVWLHGEHDIATEVSVVVTTARAAQRDDADGLVDLSEVTFMDASTIGTLVGSRNRRRARSQALLLRAPSPPARRLLDLCGLADLVHHAGFEPSDPAGIAAALGTWVDVPAIRALHGSVAQPVPAERPETARPVLSRRTRPSQTRATIEDRGRP